MQNQLRQNIIVCVSGGGRSLENLLANQENSNYRVSAVISSNITCKANSIAKEHGIPVYCEHFPLDPASESYIANANKTKNFIDSYSPKLIVLAGFLRPFPLEICAPNIKTINIHPALLPKYGGHGMYGRKVHEAVIASDDEHTGASIHFVTPIYDEGKLISQINVARHKDDDATTLAKRVFEAEKKLLPLTINMLLAGDLPTADNSIFKVF